MIGPRELNDSLLVLYAFSASGYFFAKSSRMYSIVRASPKYVRELTAGEGGSLGIKC
jgi:hypothetical protein